MELFVDDVYKWLKYLKIDKCVMIGHSLGGIVAQEFALKYQSMLHALVLVDTTSEKITQSPEMAKLRIKIDEIAHTRGVEAAFDYDLKNNPATIKRYNDHPEILERMRKKTAATSLDAYIGVWKALQEYNGTVDRIAQIKIPTLIAYGGDDLPLIKASRVLYQGIPDSDIIMILGAGHGPHYEKPAEFNKALLVFLKKLNW